MACLLLGAHSVTPLDLVLERLATTGNTPKRSGSAWAAKCPAHPDGNPSLSINEGRDGNAILYCHAGCELGDILQALNLEMTDLFPPKPKSELGEIIATYTYEDETGHPVLRVNRHHPKTFRQMHNAGGTWVWGAGKARKLLYRLPQVTEACANTGTVWLAEGEKDVHALEAAGVIATCNAAGAGKFYDTHSDQLQGAGLVIIVCDNDAAGIDHVRKVSAELTFANIPYKIVMPTEGKDAYDHFAAGHGIDEFVSVVSLDAVEVDDITPAVMPEEWLEPIPLGSSKELPPFPLDALPDWIADQARAVGAELQMPADLAAVMSLACLSAICARKARVKVRGDWFEQLNLYIAVAMPPSAGKSPAFAAMLAPLKQFEQQQIEDKAIDIAKSEQAQRMAERKVKKAEESDDTSLANKALEELLRLPKTISPRMIADDATPEALTALLANHDGRIALLSTEGGLFDLMTGRYSDKANLDVYLKAWGGDDITVDRIGRGPSAVKRPALTIGITVQPSVIAALADKPELAGRGLTARFMYAIPKDTVGQRDFVNQRDQDPLVGAAYNAEMLAIAKRFANSGEMHVLTLSSEARAIFNVWRQDLEDRRKPDGDLRPLAEWSTKLESSVVRVAGLLHLAGGGNLHDTLEVEQMSQAIKIGDYWLAHSFAVHDLWGTDAVLTQARIVLEWAKDLDTFSIRDCYTKFRTMLPKAELAVPALSLLIERGWLRPVDNQWPPRLGKRGVESPLLEVHPIHARHARHARAKSSEIVEITAQDVIHARHARHALRDLSDTNSLSSEQSEKKRSNTGSLTHDAHDAHDYPQAQLAATGTDDFIPTTSDTDDDPNPHLPDLI